MNAVVVELQTGTLPEGFVRRNFREAGCDPPRWNFALIRASIRPMQGRPRVYPVIAVAGLPRVGSMWSFNVARALVREEGLDVLPDRVPKANTNQTMIMVSEAYLTSKPANTRCVIKVHMKLTPSPTVKVIRNKRDLRDRIFSYCQFMRARFDEDSIGEVVSRSVEVDSHYDQWPAASILNIPFESIGTDGIELIRRISEFIDLPISDPQILRTIDFQFSKQQVRKQIAALDARVFDQKGNVRHSADPDAVLAGSGRLRAFDVATGFQSGHVTDYRSGDWKSLWTDRQKQMVNDAIRTAQHRYKTRIR